MNRETYEYKKANGICVRCGGESRKGKTRCAVCARLEMARIKPLTGEKREKHLAYMREYAKTHKPSKEKKSEYNRRYREGWY